MSHEMLKEGIDMHIIVRSDDSFTDRCKGAGRVEGVGAPDFIASVFHCSRPSRHMFARTGGDGTTPPL